MVAPSATNGKTITARSCQLQPVVGQQSSGALLPSRARPKENLRLVWNGHSRVAHLVVAGRLSWNAPDDKTVSEQVTKELENGFSDAGLDLLWLARSRVRTEVRVRKTPNDDGRLVFVVENDNVPEVGVSGGEDRDLARTRSLAKRRGEPRVQSRKQSVTDRHSVCLPNGLVLSCRAAFETEPAVPLTAGG